MLLLTGGTGFLGGHIARQLAESGRSFRLFCRSDPGPELRKLASEIARGDLSDPATLRPALAGVESVIHVAGLVDFDPDARGVEQLHAVNVVGTRSLLEACVDENIRKVVHVSSVSAIGAAKDFDHPLSEDDFGNGLGTDLPYPRSKLEGEKTALEFAERGLPVVVVNPTFFAGPMDVNLSSARTIVSFLKRQVWVGLSRGGMGYTDVRDVASGIISALEKGRPGRRYILGGWNLRLREYHELLAKATGLRPPFLFLPPALAVCLAKVGLAGYHALGIKTYVAPGDIRLAQHYWVYRYDRAKHELGMTCRTPEDSLRDAVAWIREVGIEKF